MSPGAQPVRENSGTADYIALWFRADLRLEDHQALSAAIESARDWGLRVLPVFIFDSVLLSGLAEDDRRLAFIRHLLGRLDTALAGYGSGLLTERGSPVEVWPRLLKAYRIAEVHASAACEPYGVARDRLVGELLARGGVRFIAHWDGWVSVPGSLLKQDGKPYTVYTPYYRTWLARLRSTPDLLRSYKPELAARLLARRGDLRPESRAALVSDEAGRTVVRAFSLEGLDQYHLERDIPSLDAGTGLGPHLRFGTVSVREIVRRVLDAGIPPHGAAEGGLTASPGHECFLGELAWRDFFAQILFHFPDSAGANFKRRYDSIRWRQDAAGFEAWREGRTGFPLVDAGMRQLAATGRMHNRVRMLCASFLCKDLLIDWREGEAWFARLLLDYDQASNVGNWQWAAGTGCDAVPYFRIFNPLEQQKRWDPEAEYIRRWIPEYGTPGYPGPLLDHARARLRALAAYKSALA